MRRVLHIPAYDLMVGDKVVFSDSARNGINGFHEAILIEKTIDHSDGDIYLKFDDAGWTKYCSPIEQFTMVQEV